VTHTRRFLVCACFAALLAASAPASAQYRGPAPGHSHVVVRAGYYRPYYYHPFVYPYYYSPFYFGFGVYYNALWGGYPYAAPYAYGYPYAYPYPYYYSSWASARIEVKPRDAQVFIDGYYVGVVDQFDGVLQRLDIPGGEHELAIYMPGYHTYREHTLFRPGQTYHYKATLEALPAGSPAEPKPQPDPRAQQQNYGPDQYRGGEPPQPYGEGPYRQPPPPPQDRRARPAPPQGGQRGEFGTLSLRVQPADAVVTIDGERWDSPEGGSRLVVQLPPGTHRVEVRKEGFRPYSTTVEIRPGESQSVNVSLPQGVSGQL